MSGLSVLHVAALVAEVHGGPAVALRGLVAQQAADGDDVTVIGSAYGTEVNLQEALSRQGGTWLLYRSTSPTLFSFSLRLALRLARDVPRQSVVHIHGYYTWPSVVAAWFCRRARVPYILRPHGSLEQYQRAASVGRKRVFERIFGGTLRSGAALVHFTSVSEQQAAADLVPRSRAYVAPLGVAATPVDVARPPWFPDAADARVLLFLGRLARKKQPHLLIDAFSLLSGAFPQWHLVIVGSDAEWTQAALSARAQSLGLERSVILHSFVAGSEKAAVLRWADYFVLPSLNENYGVAAAEAVMHGTFALLTRDVATLPELGSLGIAREIRAQNSAVLAEDLRVAMETVPPDKAVVRRLAHDRLSWSASGAGIQAMYAAAIRSGDIKCAD